MKLDRVRAELELACNLLVAHALCDESEYLAVTRAQADLLLQGRGDHSLPAGRHDRSAGRHVLHGCHHVVGREALEDDATHSMLDRAANDFLAHFSAEHHDCGPRMGAQRPDSTLAATGSASIA